MSRVVDLQDRAAISSYWARRYRDEARTAIRFKGFVTDLAQSHEHLAQALYAEARELMGIA